MTREYYILHKNFSYSGASVNYNSSYECESWGCDQEGICRCGTINDENISNVDVDRMVELIYYELFGDDKSSKRDDKLNQILNGYGRDFDIYTIDRILRINKVYNPDNWDIEVCSGYYGQEIGDVTVKETLAKKLEDLINQALDIEDMGERINFLLMLEYGSIHPKLTDVKYSIIEIDKDLIIYGSQSNKKASLKEIQNILKYHYDDSNNRWLKNINNIKGIVVPDGDRLRLIDGYHRCLSTSRKMIKVIVGNK